MLGQKTQVSLRWGALPTENENILKPRVPSRNFFQSTTFTRKFKMGLHTGDRRRRHHCTCYFASRHNHQTREKRGERKNGVRTTVEVEVGTEVLVAVEVSDSVVTLAADWSVGSTVTNTVVPLTEYFAKTLIEDLQKR